ncbi:hypothetical protein D3C81_2104800 [compost metagenome]
MNVAVYSKATLVGEISIQPKSLGFVETTPPVNGMVEKVAIIMPSRIRLVQAAQK